MPAPMPGHVSKGRTLAKLDKALNVEATRKEFFERISARTPDGRWKEDLVDVGVDLVGLDRDEAEHLRHHWFDARSGWWLPHQPLEIVVRHGLIRAIELAGRKRGGGDPKWRDLDFYWVCGISTVEVTSCVSDAQVTTVVITPGPPMSDRIPGDYEGVTDTDPIYTTRHHSRGPGEREVALPQDHVEFVQPLRP